MRKLFSFCHAVSMPFRSVLTLAGLTLTCLIAVGQAPLPATTQTATTQKASSREVLLPVTVRDKKGVLVTSLKQSDFVLTEDGHPQTITSFTRESNQPFRLGLLVDTSRGMTGALDSERKAAGKFVDQMLSPDSKSDSKTGTDSKPDQAFLIHFDSEVELLEDFTNSRDKLHRELDEMGPSRVARNSSQGPESSGDDRSSRDGQSRASRGGTDLYDAIYLAADELMKPKDGRKALVLFSDGVDRGSKQSLNDAVDAADRANLAVYTIYFKGEQERSLISLPGSGGRNGGTGGGWPGNGGGGYPGSGKRGGDSSKQEEDGKKIMEKIAARTGGRFFEAKKKENLEEIYSQIAEELRGQYLLTYTPDAVDKEDGFHKIVLKANNDNLIVTTREGYYAPGRE